MNMQQDPSRPAVTSTPPQATSIPDLPPSPSDTGVGLRSRNRIRAHGVEAIRWIPQYLRNSREIQNMFQGRTPFTVAHVDDGILELATFEFDGLGETRSIVTVQPRQWVVFADRPDGQSMGPMVLDDEALRTLLRGRAEEARVRSEKRAAKLQAETAAAVRPLCNAASQPNLPNLLNEPDGRIIHTCTLPAGHGGRWHQCVSDDAPTVAWREPPSTQEVLLEQAARIMDEMLQCGVLDGSSYGAEVRAWVRMWVSSGLGEPVPLRFFDNETEDTIGSPTGNVIQEETKACDEGNS